MSGKREREQGGFFFVTMYGDILIPLLQTPNTQHPTCPTPSHYLAASVRLCDFLIQLSKAPEFHRFLPPFFFLPSIYMYVCISYLQDWGVSPLLKSAQPVKSDQIKLQTEKHPQNLKRACPLAIFFLYNYLYTW